MKAGVVDRTTWWNFDSKTDKVKENFDINGNRRQGEERKGKGKEWEGRTEEHSLSIFHFVASREWNGSRYKVKRRKSWFEKNKLKWLLTYRDRNSIQAYITDGDIDSVQHAKQDHNPAILSTNLSRSKNSTQGKKVTSSGGEESMNTCQSPGEMKWIELKNNFIVKS